MRHQVLIFTKLNTWVGCNYHTWLCPKDTELRAPSVPKAKLGQFDYVRHRLKGEGRTLGLLAPLGLYIQEVILPLVMVILGFLTIPWLDSKDTELHAPLVPKAKLEHLNCVRNGFFLYIYCSYIHGLGSTILLV